MSKQLSLRLDHKLFINRRSYSESHLLRQLVGAYNYFPLLREGSGDVEAQARKMAQVSA
jgi:hypothetical protein